MKKSILIISALFTMLSAIPAMAGWELGTGQNADKWRYNFGANKYSQNNYAYDWNWLDGNNDGIYEHYYFQSDRDGKPWMLSNTYTPDGHFVNANGAREFNGQVVTIDNRFLPVTPYANYYTPNKSENFVFSYVTFTLNDLVDHGTYYEIRNQGVHKEVPNDMYFDYDTIYTGSVYLHKNATGTSPSSSNYCISLYDAFAMYPYEPHVFQFDGTYSWTLFDMDSKGYYMTFTAQQLP